MTYTPNYSPRRVYWSSQESISDFAPTATNTAGSFDLATEGVVLCGAATRGQSLVFTTTDLWSITYTGGDFVFSFRREGNNCGILAPHAFAVVDPGGAFWMGAGKFYQYDGIVKDIPCEVSDAVFGNFNTAQSALVWCIANPLFGEVTWFYPSLAATENDRYVTYSYQENHWTYGAMARTTGVTQQSGHPMAPVMIDANGHIYDHESGDLRTGIGTIFIDSGPMMAGEGDHVARVQRVIPDDRTLGDVSATIYAALEPDAAETSQGPVTLTSPTSVRITGRQFRLRLQEVNATAWRVGVVRLGAIIGGTR